MISDSIIHTYIKMGDEKVKAKVAERGQVTIPKTLRERLGIRPGTMLDFSTENGRLVAVKFENVHAVDQIYGKFGKGRPTDENRICVMVVTEFVPYAS